MTQNNYLALAEDIVIHTGDQPQALERLLAGVKSEYAFACPDGAAAEGEGLALLCDVAKLIRLGGEWPYYTAQLIALYLTGQADFVEADVSVADCKKAVVACTGFVYEVELAQMIAEAYYQIIDNGLALMDEKKESLMRDAYRKGYHYEKTYRGCAQCAMAAVSDVTGKEDLTMFRAANGLAGGMGLLGDGVCGGYSGGLLSMGLFAGRRREFFDGDKAEKDLCGKLAGQLHGLYIDTYGSVICHDIHRDIFGRAFHITRPDDKEAFEEAGAHQRDKCPAVVGTAAAWTVGILFDEDLV